MTLPGVEWQMAASAQIWVQSGSAFTAVGTADNPVVIRGAEQTAGFWNRILFDSSKTTDNRIEHFMLADAGSDDNIAIALLSDINHGTSSATVKNGTIKNIDGAGIWVDDTSRGTSTLTCSDITFENVSGDKTAGGASCT